MRKILIASLSVVIIFIITQEIFGWGNVGHSLINRNSTKHFPQEMNSFKLWSEFLAQHASDADYRKSQDPNEGNKHFIDIDNYQEFLIGNFPNMAGIMSGSKGYYHGQQKILWIL